MWLSRNDFIEHANFYVSSCVWKFACEVFTSRRSFPDTGEELIFFERDTFSNVVSVIFSLVSSELRAREVALKCRLNKLLK